MLYVGFSNVMVLIGYQSPFILIQVRSFLHPSIGVADARTVWLARRVGVAAVFQVQRRQRLPRRPKRDIQLRWLVPSCVYALFSCLSELDVAHSLRSVRSLAFLWRHDDLNVHRPYVARLSSIVFSICVRLRILQAWAPSDMESGFANTPGNARAEAERRRCAFLLRLDDRSVFIGSTELSHYERSMRVSPSRLDRHLRLTQRLHHLSLPPHRSRAHSPRLLQQTLFLMRQRRRRRRVRVAVRMKLCTSLARSSDTDLQSASAPLRAHQTDYVDVAVAWPFLRSPDRESRLSSRLSIVSEAISFANHQFHLALSALWTP